MRDKTFAAHILRLIEEGFEVTMGSHLPPLLGYYALVFRKEDADECQECENPIGLDWGESGHSLSVWFALGVAEAIAKGEHVTIRYKPSDFVEVSKKGLAKLGEQL